MLLVLVSVVSFVIIQLPPGDYLSTYIMATAGAGRGRFRGPDRDAARPLRPGAGRIYVQYFKWMWGVLRGNFGVSFEWNQAGGVRSSASAWPSP